MIAKSHPRPGAVPAFARQLAIAIFTLGFFFLAAYKPIQPVTVFEWRMTFSGRRR